MPDPLRGLDANRDLTKHAACLKTHGFDFAMRYYNIHNPAKNLTLGEAQALVRTGFQLGAIFEDGFPIKPSFFSHAKGVLHGTTAHHMAMNKIGQPENTPIHFAVDFDAAPNDVATVIKDYFEGVRDGFLAISQGNPRYQIGVYGSGLTCSKLLEDGLVTFTWLAQSTGFRGSKEFAKQRRYNLIQFLAEDVCDVNLDLDQTNPDKPSPLFTVQTV